MRIADKIEFNTLERREAQLSILAIVVIAVMSIGMAAAMYPLVFAHPITSETETARRAFYGFCVLSILMVTYLTNRHIVIRRLRRTIVEGQQRIDMIRRQASTDLLRTLPGTSRFQDRLTMEFRRCVRTGDRLSLLLILATVRKEFSGEGEIDNAYGDVAKALLVRLRKDDAIYGFKPGAFGVVLVAPNAAAVTQITNRLIQSLEEARAASGRFSFETRVISYPEQATTAWEMEQAMHSFLRVDQPAQPAATAAAS
ncbi:MAG: hypothetical protein ABSB82_20060 [Terriglobia bacterium]|jgi:GGDEF domain-containing protein